MKLYGSLTNRLEENRQFVDEIKVGDGVTEYFYSDRHAYEVIEVKDQKHITIREYDAKHIGEAYTNNWELISNENNATYALVKRGKYWYTASTITRDELIPMLDEQNRIKVTEDNFCRAMWIAHNFDIEKVLEKGKQTSYHRKNITIGKADYYYDYEF